jgi:hypothetical protein
MSGSSSLCPAFRRRTPDLTPVGCGGANCPVTRYPRTCASRRRAQVLKWLPACPDSGVSGRYQQQTASDTFTGSAGADRLAAWVRVLETRALM